MADDGSMVPMNTAQVAEHARSLMDEHGLEDWAIDFGRSTKSAGACYYSRRLIRFSRVIMTAYDDAAVRNTILHEIAHALVGSRHGHDGVWRRKFLELGGNGEARTLATAGVAKAIEDQSKYRAVCSGCGETYSAQRRKKSFGRSMCSDASCPVSYHKTRFTGNHVYLVWIDTATRKPVNISG